MCSWRNLSKLHSRFPWLHPSAPPGNSVSSPSSYSTSNFLCFLLPRPHHRAPTHNPQPPKPHTRPAFKLLQSPHHPPLLLPSAARRPSRCSAQTNVHSSAHQSSNIHHSPLSQTDSYPLHSRHPYPHHKTRKGTLSRHTSDTSALLPYSSLLFGCPPQYLCANPEWVSKEVKGET